MQDEEGLHRRWSETKAKDGDEEALRVDGGHPRLSHL